MNEKKLPVSNCYLLTISCVFLMLIPYHLDLLEEFYRLQYAMLTRNSFLQFTTLLKK